MYYFVAIFFGAMSLVKADDIDRCMDTATFGRSCCNFDISEEIKAILKTCFETTGEHHSCEFEVCLGQKRGFIMSNGTVDKDALSETIKSDFKKFTGLADKLIDKCLSVEEEDYEEEDSCYTREIAQCLSFYAMANCPKWTQSNECTRIKSLIEDCKDVVP